MINKREWLKLGKDCGEGWCTSHLRYVGRNAEGNKKGLPKLQTERKRTKKDKEVICSLHESGDVRLTDGVPGWLSWLSI